MRICLFTGGTLGHIMPCVVLIKEIKKRYKDTYIILVSTTKDKDYEILKSDAIDKNYYIDCFKASINLKEQLTNISAYRKIKNILKEEAIDIAFGFGGYISGIGILAAKSIHLKIYLHEQNSVMGKANKLLSKYAKKVFLSYPVKNMNDNYEIVGNPVYLNAINIKKDIYKVKNKILFTSGTLGARVINMLAVNLINSGYLKEYDIYIVTGKKYYEEVKKLISNKDVKIYPFSNNLISEIASSDIVISRAGSSTLFEILGTKTLSIIIPSINVTANHQYHNAVYFKKLGLIEMIEEKDLTLTNFINTFNTLITEKELYQERINKYQNNHQIDKMIDEVFHE